VPSEDNVPFLILRKVCSFFSFLAVIRSIFVLHLACIHFSLFRYTVINYFSASEVTTLRRYTNLFIIIIIIITNAHSVIGVASRS